MKEKKTNFKKDLFKGVVYKECNRQNTGITLIALILTIIVLIILASVTLNMLINNGIIDKAKLARDKYLNSANEESKSLEEIYSQILLADSEGTSLQNVDMVTLKSLIQQEVQKATPTGTIIAYSVNNVPDGYLKCEGQAVSRTDYKTLFDIIGTTYGSGDGSTTFNVPDLRGEFLRGTGTNSHTNQGNGASVGTHQDGTEHLNFIPGSNSLNYPKYAGASWTGTNRDTTSPSSYSMQYYGAGTNSGWSNGLYYTSRPTNTSVLYCIKY